MPNVCHHENGRPTSAADRRDGDDERDVPRRAGRPAARAVHATSAREAAAEREREQHDRRRPASRPCRQPRARDRVVGGLAVRRERRCAPAKRGRHRVAMRGDVRDLAAREPQLQRRPTSASATTKTSGEGSGGIDDADAVRCRVCENSADRVRTARPFYANATMPQDAEPPDLDRHGNDRPQARHRPHHRGRAGRHRHRSRRPSPRRRCGSSIRTTRRSTAMDAWNQGTHGALGPDRQGEGVDARRGRGRSAALAFLREHVPAEGVADVRQLDLPGPALPRALDAGARGLLPLPQPRRVDAEGAGAALEARAA